MTPDKWAGLAVLASCIFALAAWFRAASRKVDADVAAALAEAKFRADLQASLVKHELTYVEWPERFISYERARCIANELICTAHGQTAEAEFWKLAGRAS